jgi:hypothetical protein
MKRLEKGDFEERKTPLPLSRKSEDNVRLEDLDSKTLRRLGLKREDLMARDISRETDPEGIMKPLEDGDDA